MPDVTRVVAMVRRGVVFELRLYRSLLRWLARRPYVGGADAEVFLYAELVTPVIWMWIFASGIEIVVVDLLLPWHTVRVVALVIGAWGLVWMCGLLASLHVHPHLLDPSALRVRHGFSVDVAIPWTAIAAITVQERDVPSSVRTLQPRETETGTDLRVGVSGRVNARVVLHGPTTVPTPKGDLSITELAFWVDEPRALVARARQQVLQVG